MMVVQVLWRWADPESCIVRYWSTCVCDSSIDDRSNGITGQPLVTWIAQH